MSRIALSRLGSRPVTLGVQKAGRATGEGQALAENDDEIAALKQRLAELEARDAGAEREADRPQLVRPVSTSGFGSGFFGCFGVLAAVIVVALALVTCSQIRRAPGAASGSAAGMADSPYAENCAAGLVDADAASSAIRRPALSIAAPVVLSNEIPKRVQCGFTSLRGSGAVTVDVACGGPDRGCTTLVSAVLNNEVVYSRRVRRPSR